MAWPSTFVAGNPLTATQLNGIQAAGLAWTTFTPTLTGATTNPTGQTYTGSAYIQIGQTVHFRANITMAATTGTGAYSIALPVLPKNVEQNVTGIIADTGVGSYRCTLTLSGAATASILVDPTTAGAIMRAATSTIPFTIGAADRIVINGTYEAA